jgi:hypothetical protein
MNPEVVVLPPFLGALAILYAWGPRRDAPLARRHALVLALDVPIVAAFAWANHVSSARFPELPIAPWPDPRRIVMFVINTWVPFEVPVAVKVACVVVIVVGVLLARDRALLVLMAGMLASAVLWGMLRGYPLAPRYLYIGAVFATVILARLLGLLASTARTDTAVLVGLCAPLAVAGIVAIRSYDLVLFDALSTEGGRLMEVQHEARAEGRRLRVRVTPATTLSEGDLRFFGPELVFVASGGESDRVVDNGLAQYRGLLGERVNEPYWVLRWFSE